MRILENISLFKLEVRWFEKGKAVAIKLSEQLLY